ncbi:MAG: beta-hydroxyacyl-ACP dehydratase [Rhodocyclaceae bacterium]|nr:beta-hydroxyacyl-ACP dehydratase [Rhodocyclaceae bacterium]
MSNDDAPLSFDINGIQAHQRNRHPVLLIDRVTEVVPGKTARAVKCFAYNEWFFPAHFEDDPNVPGFVQVECLAQTFIMTFLTLDAYKGMKTNYASIDKVQFKRRIVPGDVLVIDATLNTFRRGIARGIATSHVDGVAACSAEFVIVLPEVLAGFTPKH